jgi:hypothetical protein
MEAIEVIVARKQIAAMPAMTLAGLQVRALILAGISGYKEAEADERCYRRAHGPRACPRLVRDEGPICMIGEGGGFGRRLTARSLAATANGRN